MREETIRDQPLAGEKGRVKRPVTNHNCLGCPGMVYHAYAVHDGRPVVISIDWWTIAFDELPESYVAEILSSFRFRD